MKMELKNKIGLGASLSMGIFVILFAISYIPVYIGFINPSKDYIFITNIISSIIIAIVLVWRIPETSYKIIKRKK